MRFLLLFTLCFSCIVLSMQDTQAQFRRKYKKGRIWAHTGVGFGIINDRYGEGSIGHMPPITFTAEYSYDNHLAFGPYVGVYTRNYQFSGDREGRLISYAVGGRVTYHASDQLNDWVETGFDSKLLDIYGSLISGVEFRRWSYDQEFPLQQANDKTLIFGPILGVRYFFSDVFALYAEGGRGTFSWLSVGISLRLKKAGEFL